MPETAEKKYFCIYRLDGEGEVPPPHVHTETVRSVVRGERRWRTTSIVATPPFPVFCT